MERSLKKRLLLHFLLAFLFDTLLVTSLIAILSHFYYSDNKARLLWKVTNTCDALVILFEIRMRLLCCLGYPFKNMSDVSQTLGLGARCCLCTRIRMKLVDYLCFFYIFFSEVVKVTVLLTHQSHS